MRVFIIVLFLTLQFSCFLFHYDAFRRCGLGDSCYGGTLFILCMTRHAYIHVDSAAFHL